MSAAQFRSVADLPPDDVIIKYVKNAIRLNEQDIKLPTTKTKPGTSKLAIPDYFKAALQKNKQALATFESFSFSNKRDYVDWLTEAKQEVTRQKRLKTAIEWLSEGKPQNWKYLKKW
jgi:uncharacterized protein YdeI (YjbR/CyaY-like superfamily)